MPYISSYPQKRSVQFARQVVRVDNWLKDVAVITLLMAMLLVATTMLVGCFYGMWLTLLAVLPYLVTHAYSINVAVFVLIGWMAFTTLAGWARRQIKKGPR